MDFVFLSIGLMIIIATISAFFASKFKQPLIPFYILAGLLLEPMLKFLLSNNWFSLIFKIPADFTLSHAFINSLSEIGIAFLLFMVGIEIDLKKLKDVEKLTTFGSLIQVIILFALGFAAATLMFFTRIEAVYVGLIVAFSSTMVVVKVLSDRKELDTLHGRIIIGILIVQDIIAIFALIILNSIDNFSLFSLGQTMFSGILILLLAIFLSKFVFTHLFRIAARSRELFFLASISVCFLFSLFFQSIGFSIAIGAFVAGVSLGNLPYNLEIIGRVKSLRDFFAILFFVSLGLQLPLEYLRGAFLPLVVFTLIVVILKPIIFLLVIGFFGYKKRTSFLSAISLAQISEFSLILVTQGMILGHISQKLFAITILLAIVTIALSSYFMKWEYKLYTWLADDLTIFERLNTHEDKLEYLPKKEKYEVILIGYDRTGYSIFHKLLKLKRNFLVIDFNPEVIKKLIRQKIPSIYGDAGNIEILERLNFHTIKYLISTIPDMSTSLLLTKKAKRINKDLVVFVTAYQVDEALKLYDAGADYVVLPHFLGGHHASVLLEEASKDITKLLRRKVRHIKELHHRKEIGHEHPKAHHNHKKYQ